MSLKKSARNLGKIYGLAERALPKILGDPDKKVAASESPINSLAEIMRLLLTKKALSDELDKDIRELLDDVDVDTPEHIDQGSQALWWIGYYSMRHTDFDHGIAAMRRRKGMTQAKLAAAVGTNQRAVSRWETGVVRPGANYLNKMADVLDCKTDDLI